MGFPYAGTQKAKFFVNRAADVDSEGISDGQVLVWSSSDNKYVPANNGGSLPSLTDGNIWVGNASNAATAVVMSGDATLANTGVITIANSAVTFAKYQNISQGLVGRPTSGSGVSSLVTLDSSLSFGVSSVAVARPLPTGDTNRGMIYWDNGTGQYVYSNRMRINSAGLQFLGVNTDTLLITNSSDSSTLFNLQFNGTGTWTLKNTFSVSTPATATWRALTVVGGTNGASGADGVFSVVEGSANKALHGRARHASGYPLYLENTSGLVAYVNSAGETFQTGNALIDNQKELRLRELTASGTNYIGFRAAATMSADYTLTYPASAPTARKILKNISTTAGTLEWGGGGFGTSNLDSGSYSTTTSTSYTTLLSISNITSANSYFKKIFMPFHNGGTDNGFKFRITTQNGASTRITGSAKVHYNSIIEHYAIIQINGNNTVIVEKTTGSVPAGTGLLELDLMVEDSGTSLEIQGCVGTAGTLSYLGGLAAIDFENAV